MNEIDRFREALAKIAEVARTAANGDEYLDTKHGEGAGHTPETYPLGCTLKALPQRLQVKAAQTAMKINPVNAPVFGPLAAGAPELAAMAADLVRDPQLLTRVSPLPRVMMVPGRDTVMARLDGDTGRARISASCIGPLCGRRGDRSPQASMQSLRNRRNPKASLERSATAEHLRCPL
jgi:hypothetical protein